MPKNTITILSVTCGVLVFMYVALIGVAIFFATLRTELGAEVRQAETRVAALETKYYEAIAKLNATDVTALGYVSPTQVGYVALDGTHTVTRAD